MLTGAQVASMAKVPLLTPSSFGMLLSSVPFPECGGLGWLKSRKDVCDLSADLYILAPCGAVYY